MKKLKDYMEKEKLNIEKVITDYSTFLYKNIKNHSYNLKTEDVEEIVSDTFFVLWKNYKKMDLDDKISNYLIGVSKNILFNKLRKNKIKYNSVNLEDYKDIFSTKEDVESLYEGQDKARYIENIVNSMDKESKEIFILFYYEQRKIKEISKILGVSESKVKTRLHRIRKKIKKELEKGGYRYEQ